MFFLNRLKNRCGVTIIIFASVIVVILGFSALVTDIGYLLVEKYRLKNTADVAALAGVRELMINRENAETVAIEYIRKNDSANITYEILIPDNGYILTVKLKKKVYFFFAKVFGIYETEIYAQSTAKLAPVGAVKGARPLVVQQQSFNYGQEYVLKEGAGSGENGNYGAISLGGTGADRYRDNLMYGYNEKLRIGDIVETQPGNLHGPTEQGINYLLNRCNHEPKCTYQNYVANCPRLIIIPVVDKLDVNGRKPVMIVGFAAFFIERYENKGGHSQIIGRFIKTITDAELSEGASDFGLRGIKLVE